MENRKLMQFVGMSTVVSFLVCTVFYILYGTDKDIKYMLIGALVSGFYTVLGFYFGSSQGSKDKTELLKRKADEQ